MYYKVEFDCGDITVIYDNGKNLYSVDNHGYYMLLYKPEVRKICAGANFFVALLAKTPPTLWSYLETGTGPGGTAFWTDLRMHIATMKRSAIFRERYNDRIAYRAGAKDAFYRYIKDNPYRYVIRKMHPEFFGNTLDLKIGDTWL